RAVGVLPAFLAGAIFLLSAVAGAGPVAAQADSPATPLTKAVQSAAPDAKEGEDAEGAVPPEDVEQLIQRLEDPEQRQALIQDLRVL
ncbi:hypothetical protein R0J87_22025, partial [Halomonas sp. SIMBA_159]